MYCPHEGQTLLCGVDQSPFPAQTGVLWLLEGQIRVEAHPTCRQRFEAGSFIGLERGFLAPEFLKYTALSPVKGRFWTPEALELYVGKDIQFALRALVSLSQQQRSLNQALIQQRHGLAVKASASGSSAPLEISTAPSALSHDTQYSLYQLAFTGPDGLSPDILQRFGRHFPAGAVLCREGDSGTELFILLQGRVVISHQGKHMGHMEAGELFGEMAVLEGQSRSATVTAEVDTLTLALNREHFQMIFQLHPSWTWKLLAGFGQRLATVWQQLVPGE